MKNNLHGCEFQGNQTELTGANCFHVHEQAFYEQDQPTTRNILEPPCRDQMKAGLYFFVTRHIKVLRDDSFYASRIYGLGVEIQTPSGCTCRVQSPPPKKNQLSKQKMMWCVMSKTLSLKENLITFKSFRVILVGLSPESKINKDEDFISSPSSSSLQNDTTRLPFGILSEILLSILSCTCRGRQSTNEELWYIGIPALAHTTLAKLFLFLCVHFVIFQPQTAE